MGGEKAHALATIDVETPDKQLDISVSKLNRQDDWDDFVKMNVNRWRGQLGLESLRRRSGPRAWKFDVAAADAKAIWVDLWASQPSADRRCRRPFARRHGGWTRFQTVPQAGPKISRAEADPRLKFERPEGWRDGRMSSMRMAAFQRWPRGLAGRIDGDSRGRGSAGKCGPLAWASSRGTCS